MKHGRTVAIKNPTLRRLRNNLGIILHEADVGLSTFYYNKSIEIGNKLEYAKSTNDEETFYRMLKQSRIIDNRREKLTQAFFKSIYQCKQCYTMESDMTYSKTDNRWYCVDCFNQIHFDPDSITLNLTKSQLKTFLNRLAGPEACQYDGFQCKCGGKEYPFAKKILSLMNVPEEEQDKLLRLCKAYGGYCDCEILMNAAPRLLEEETPW